MKKSWDWKSNISYTVDEELANPTTGTRVRSGGVRGTMFQGPLNDSKIYTYGKHLDYRLHTPLRSV